MDELITHLKDEEFAGVKDRLKKCTTQVEQNKILAGLDDKRLTEFLSWLQADGACTGRCTW
jgi:hypothetical protein